MHLSPPIRQLQSQDKVKYVQSVSVQAPTIQATLSDPSDYVSGGGGYSLQEPSGGRMYASSLLLLVPCSDPQIQFTSSSFPLGS